MLPPVSLPMAKPTNPAAVAAPGPALDPDDPSSSSHGFMVWPPNQMSLSASAPRLSLATSTAPASCRRFTTAASCAGHAVAIRLGAVGGGDAGRVEKVLGAPGNAVQRPAILACRDLLVGLPRLRQRQLARERDDAVQLRVEALQSVQIDVREPLRGDLALLDPARELRHTERRRCPRRSPAAALDLCGFGRIGRVRSSLSVRAVLAFQRDQGATAGSSATLRGPVRRS